MRKRSFIIVSMMVMICVFVITGIVSAAGEVVLKIWDTAAPLRDPYRKMIFEKFEKENPGIKVEFEGIPWGQFMEKIITSIAAGTAPDVIRFGYAPRFASRGMLVPLDDFINGPDGLDLSEYVDGALNAAHMWEGKIYALPHNLVPYGVFYNLSILEGAGASIPQTFEEFVALAEKLTVKDEKGEFVQRGVQISEYVDYMILFLYNRGARDVEVYNHSVKELTLNTPEGVQGLTDLAKLYQSGAAIFANNEQPFVTGYTAMWITQSNDAFMFRPEAYPDFKFDFSLLPPPEGREAVLAGVSRDGAFIPVTSKHKDLAWKLCKAYASKEATALLYQGKYGTLPPFKDILVTPPATPAYEPYQKDPFLRKLAQIVSKNKMISPIYHWHMEGEEIGNIMTEEFGLAVRGAKSPQEALDSMTKRINEILQR
ncbi:sugar ABC transporter substrate-binding protein [Thermatribacter velox]|uniref:Sugar ABC transporter substrate-binding protein n=1 Tax=Thermatribacter velox TaxID=3039681 RepID=A0ABZ2YCV1_9BACT|nr:multiple sugar transport system substrate-binding protein [Candidatus Atribacteria bacterium]